MKNQDLFNAYKSFVISALELLNKKIANGEKIQCEIKEKVYIKEETKNSRSLGTEYVQEPLFVIFVYKYEREIAELPDYIRCVEFLAKLDKIKESYQDKIDENILKERIKRTYLCDFLIFYLNKAKSLNFFENILKEVYEEIEGYIYSSKLNFIATAPIQNFECETAEIDFGNNLKIRKITKEEFSDLYTTAKMGFGFPLYFDGMGNKFQLEMPFSIQKGNPISVQEPKEMFDKIVSALRLFKTGLVGYNSIRSKPTSWHPIMGTSTTGGLTYKNFFGSRYELKSQEVKDFIKFWHTYNTFNASKHKGIDVAIKRFVYANEREKAEDKLIDFMVALEALFLPDIFAELSYRLAIRTAIFLGDNQQKSQQIFSDVREAYDLRSHIIHGDNKVKSEDVAILTYKIEQYTRDSIIKFLAMIANTTHKQIIKDIDSNIF